MPVWPGVTSTTFSCSETRGSCGTLRRWERRKLVALLLTFAGAEYIRAVTGEYPVLLLDDLEGDIDMPNLDRLMHLVARFEQVFIASFDVARLGGGLNATSVRL